jgi:hypothetical protein
MLSLIRPSIRDPRRTDFTPYFRRKEVLLFSQTGGNLTLLYPHEGVFETHDVAASMKDKLKCLVFISIISRTYCNLKSFAWEHEFKKFAEQTAKVHFGLKVKLPKEMSSIARTWRLL